MDARQYNACLHQLRKQCDKLVDGGYHCAVVFSTPNGLLLSHGTRVIREHVQGIGDTIIADPRWQEQGENLEVRAVGTSTTIPPLQKPIKKMSLMDLRTTIPQLLRAERGRSNVGWGKPGQKPIWWPGDVPFVNPNKQPDGFHGNWMDALRNVVRRCLEHNGYRPDTHYVGAASRSPLPRPRSSSPSSRSASPRPRSASPHSRSSSPSSRSASPSSRSASPRPRSASPHSRSSSPSSRSASPRPRSASPHSRSSSPSSRSASPSSRSASPRPRSASPHSRSSSPCSRSASPRVRSASPRYRSSSPRSRSASPLSRSASPLPISASPHSRSSSSVSRSSSPCSRAASPRSRAPSPLPRAPTPSLKKTYASPCIKSRPCRQRKRKLPYSP